jgi:glutamate-1-semialdehyde 2,1-aminomutase
MGIKSPEKHAAANRTATESVTKRAATVFPGATIGSFLLPLELAVVAARGEGSHIWDVDGRRYIDYLIGSGPLILGHAHPAVVEAIREQAALGTTYYALNERIVDLAQALLEVFPADSQIKFTSSGSEATFYAMRLARAYTGRSLIVKFAGAYHGHNDYAMREAWPRPWSFDQAPTTSSAGIPEAVSATVLVAPFNDLTAVESLFSSHGPDIAAVIMEPYQRFLEPEEGFLPALEGMAHQNGSLLIADEIVTAFRFSYGLSQPRYGFTADLTALGKIIGGGLPLAAVAGKREIMAFGDFGRRGRDDFAYWSGTLNGNALAAAAGLATLRELRRPGVYERLDRLGANLRVSLHEAMVSESIPHRIFGHGATFHVLISSPDQVRNAADVAAADGERTKRFGQELIRNGLLVNPGLKAYVCLATTEDDLALSATAFASAAAVIRGN